MAKGHELEELVDGFMELCISVGERVVDGIQVSEDLPAIFLKLQTDPVFKEALDGVSNIPAEVREYGAMDYVKLFAKVASYTPRIVGVFLKKK